MTAQRSLFGDDDGVPGARPGADCPDSQGKPSQPGVGPARERCTPATQDEAAPGGIDFSIPGPLLDTLRVGTCSWKYPSWAPLVYDDDRTYHPHDFLVDYSRHFHTVEVDQWFWSLFPGGIRMPDPDTVKAYADSVPDDFRFTVKAPNAVTLTHFYSRQPPQHRQWRGRPNEHFLNAALVEKFLRALGPLHSRLGPVMFQFEYLNKKKMVSRDSFLEKLEGFVENLPRSFEWAVEVRNANLLCPSFFEILQRHGVGVVLLDGYHMPTIDRVLGKHPVFTTGFVVLRLHGPDRPGIERQAGKVWNRVVAPKDRGLDAAVRLVESAAERNVRAWVNVNNHYEGSAPLTIARLLDRLREDTA